MYSSILGVAKLQGSFLKLLSDFYVEFYSGGGVPVCWGPYLKMCSDCYAEETIQGLPICRGPSLKLLSDCDGGCQFAGILF